jgi:DNA-binding PadR family transcriptional regulator
MTNQNDVRKYLPLTEATYYIMLALIEPMHGYAVMQKVERISHGTVKVGPGTLYGVFDTLQKSGFIAMVREEDRRKTYELTSKGKRILANHVKRLEIMTNNGLAAMDRL